MGCGVGIESLGAVDGADADDQALLLEQGQIPVDRGQGNIRVLRLEHPVDVLRAGVGVRRPQAGKDDIPFFDVLRGLHRYLLCSIC